MASIAVLPVSAVALTVTIPAPPTHFFRRYLSMLGVTLPSHVAFMRALHCLTLNCSAALPASIENVPPLSCVMRMVCTVSPSSLIVPKRLEPLRV